MEIRTKSRVEREEKYAKICRKYKSLCAQYPNERPTRIMCAMAEEQMFGITTPQGFRAILKRTGTI